MALYRSYDAAIGRWHQIDPKASERESPYVGFANMPHFYSDPLGDTIRDNNGAVAKLKTSVNSQIGALNGFLNNKDTNYGALGVTKKQIQGKVSALGGVLSEISTMEGSDQVYNVTNASDEGAGVSYNSETGAVEIGVNESSSIGLIGHELKHGSQFETGEISIATNNSSYGSLYDIGDETAGYERERLLSGGIGSVLVAPRTDQWTRNFGKKIGAYQDLQSGSVNINSRQGIHLRFMKAYRQRLGLLAKEAFRENKKQSSTIK
jgi:hypothetical protein